MRKIIIITLLVALLLVPSTTFASTIKSTTLTNTFSGRHVDYGLNFWVIKTDLEGKFGTYVDEKVIEKVTINQTGRRHLPDVGEGRLSTSIKTYKGSTLVGTYHVPTGFSTYAIIIGPSTCAYWSKTKSLSDGGMRNQTLKIKANYSLFHSDVTPIGYWNAETNVLY